MIYTNHVFTSVEHLPINHQIVDHRLAKQLEGLNLSIIVEILFNPRVSYLTRSDVSLTTGHVRASVQG